MKSIKARNKVIITMVLLVGVSCFFISWKHNSIALPPIDYIKWVKDPANGLDVSKKIGDVIYSIQYEPAEYIVANMKKDTLLNSTVMRKEISNYQGMEYYIIQLKNAKSNTDILTLDLASKEEYYSREGYFSFDFQNDIYLVKGEETIPCTMFNYVPTYGISPHIDFLVAFVDKKDESNNASEDRTIVIEDKIFNNGTIKLQVKKENINKIPALITY
jgi:hypothetical protein